MQLGFFTAILPELPLEEVAAFAGREGFECLEIACWPRMRADRRYAGVTHIDVADVTGASAGQVREMLARHGLSISALGYYPNPLTADDAEASHCIEHITRVIDAAAVLGVSTVNTFVGRDPAKTDAENWATFDCRWPAIIAHAESRGIRIGIENCPMYFTADEWPAGKNLAISPAAWREMFKRIPSKSFGLNYDPSHAVWQFMDSAAHIRAFADRLFHIHAKDAKLDRESSPTSAFSRLRCRIISPSCQG